MKTKQLGSILLISVLVGALAAPASADHRRIQGSFEAEGAPYPVTATAAGDGCLDGLEGVHKVTHSLKTPFGGYLWVKMDDFVGDWDLFVVDADGQILSSSTSSNDPVFGTPGVEELSVYAPERQRLGIVACNWSGGNTAHVAYQLDHSAPPAPIPLPKKRISRVVDAQYISPSVGTAATGGQLCHVGYDLGCTAFVPSPMDRFVMIEITDHLGLPVAAEFYQYSGDDYLGDESFCGTTEEPLTIDPSADWIGVEVFAGPCEDATPAMATQGSVKFKLSSRP